MTTSDYRSAAPGSSAADSSGVRPARRRLMGFTIAVLAGIILVFAGMRIQGDVPHIIDGSLPADDDFAERYIQNPVLAYLHIGFGVVYLLGAPLQLAHRFRSRHYAVHRRLGKVLLGAGVVSGVFALAFGLPHAFGGLSEAIATAIFGSWFIACLVTAFVWIRRGDVVRHRRWMIRAFAVGLGVGTIRIWVGVFTIAGLELPDSFAVAFWVGFLLHVAAGELWLRTTPHPGG
ncbi:MAG: DUF2306 domain-containing protein [Nocardioidaceae bacterium]